MNVRDATTAVVATAATAHYQYSATTTVVRTLGTGLKGTM
jgi:hypothetical protein